MKGVRKGLWAIRRQITRKRIANNIESRARFKRTKRPLLHSTSSESFSDSHTSPNVALNRDRNLKAERERPRGAITNAIRVQCTTTIGSLLSLRIDVSLLLFLSPFSSLSTRCRVSHFAGNSVEVRLLRHAIWVNVVKSRNRRKRASFRRYSGIVKKIHSLVRADNSSLFHRLIRYFKYTVIYGL